MRVGMAGIERGRIGSSRRPRGATETVLQAFGTRLTLPRAAVVRSRREADETRILFFNASTKGVQTSMKSLIALTAIAALTLAAPQLHAQTTGPNVVDQIRSQLNDGSVVVKVDDNNAVELIDAASGNEIASIEQIDPQQIMLKGTVARISDLSQEQQRSVRQRIALFNFSSPVGTLSLDEGTGAIVMEHRLNPRMVAVPAMANAAVMFAQVARTQSHDLSMQ